MPRLRRKAKLRRVQGRQLNQRDYWQVRLQPWQPWPSWAADQVEANLRRLNAETALAWWLDRRPRRAQREER